MKYNVQVAGITFAVKDNPSLKRARPEGQVEIQLDPYNKFAKHPRGAFLVKWQGNKIGFISDAERDVQDDIVAAIDSIGKVYGNILNYAYKDSKGFNDDHNGILSAVTLSIDTGNAAKLPNETPEQLESFNEAGVVLDFYPQAHEYWYKGQRLQSATGLVSKMYKPFNAEAIAQRCAPAWGMEEDDVVAMWKSNGQAAGFFGTAIHMLIENYEKYGERALPKMPILNDIVQSFPFQPDLEVHSEVLLTCVERGICGLCDRLVIQDGKASVRDMKVQHNADKKDSKSKNTILPELPSSKVGKAIAQCSIYADMLEIAGVLVDDEVVVHVWDGEWKNHTHKRVHNILEKAL